MSHAFHLVISTRGTTSCHTQVWIGCNGTLFFFHTSRTRLVWVPLTCRVTLIYKSADFMFRWSLPLKSRFNSKPGLLIKLTNVVKRLHPGSCSQPLRLLSPVAVTNRFHCYLNSSWLQDGAIFHQVSSTHILSPGSATAWLSLQSDCWLPKQPSHA